MTTCIPGDGELAQQLTASIALAKDLTVAPSSHAGWPQLPLASPVGVQTPSSVLHGQLHSLYTDPTPYTIKNMYDLHICV